MTKRWKPHVTVAAVIERDGRYLLVEERTSAGLRLNNAAGHLERGETPVQACVREAREETAFEFVPTALIGVYLSRTLQGYDDITYLRLAFAGDLGAFDAKARLDDGIVRTVWMTPEEVEASQDLHRSPLVWQCVSDHRKGQRLPLATIFTHESVWAS
ncbi:MAG: Phosphatase NudJ [Pseudomonadota bacterium]|jgi:8-oxo-dGTP pyrophosphatase MutT (NUDIX family)